MAVRASMAGLIDTTRQLIGDVASASQDFTDQAIQDVLDAYRAEVRYELLQPMPDIQPGQNGSTVASFVWASYQSEFQYWEADVVIQGLNTTTDQPWVILSPVTFEYINGKWTFAVTLPNLSATPPGQFPPIYATGKAYDVFAAAAELLERRIALHTFTMFDFTADGRTMRLSQVLDRWERLRATYIGRSWNRVVEIIRTDLAPDIAAGNTRVLDTDLQSNYLLPGVLGADVTRGNNGGA